jgi:predicted small lipoprotein YifL
VTRFRHTLRAVLLLAAVLSLAGCGRRGPLEPPPGSADTNAPLTGVPDQYGLPKNAETAPIDSAAVSQPATDAAGKTAPASPAAPPAKAPKPFPLDPLL